jgi:hypothetical protein
MLGVRPDILHLICHGDGQNLTFADGYGDPRRVPAEHVARLLAGYRAHAGIQLTGMVLNACHSAAIAETFAPVADTVVAHHGSLEDECAQLFSERLYKTLRDVPSLGGAARIASEHLAADGSGCGGIQDGLVIVTGKTEHENR